MRGDEMKRDEIRRGEMQTKQNLFFYWISRLVGG